MNGLVLQFVLFTLAGWIQRGQQQVIDYLSAIATVAIARTPPFFRWDSAFCLAATTQDFDCPRSPA